MAGWDQAAWTVGRAALEPHDDTGWDWFARELRMRPGTADEAAAVLTMLTVLDVDDWADTADRQCRTRRGRTPAGLPVQLVTRLGDTEPAG